MRGQEREGSAKALNGTGAIALMTKKCREICLSVAYAFVDRSHSRSTGKTCATGQEWGLSCGETVQGWMIVYNITRFFPDFPR